MQQITRIALSGLAAALIATAASAQWAVYEKPTAADWAALAERPDFSGVWERGGGGGGRGRGGGRGNLAAVSPTPEYAALRDQARANAAPGQSANCLPPAMPAIMSQPYPMEFLLTPGKVTIILEAYTQVRHIYTDGRALPEFPDPNFYGTSIGRWEGDTLVVESVGFNELVTISGVPHSDELKIIERISLIDPDTMVIETTFDDPIALTEPYTMAPASFARHRDWTIAEYICQENNRNFVTTTGAEGIILDNPGEMPPPPSN